MSPAPCSLLSVRGPDDSIDTDAQPLSDLCKKRVVTESTVAKDIRHGGPQQARREFGLPKTHKGSTPLTKFAVRRRTPQGQNDNKKYYKLRARRRRSAEFQGGTTGNSTSRSTSHFSGSLSQKKKVHISSTKRQFPRKGWREERRFLHVGADPGGITVRLPLFF